MSDAKLKEELRKFKVRLLPEYSRETLERAARRIEMLAKRGMDPFDVDETWLYEYCASQLDASKKRNSLRIEMEDLGRWIKFTGQVVKVPHFTRETEQDPWFPSEEQYRDILKVCNMKFKDKIRDYLKQYEHERKWFRNALLIRILAEGGMRVSELLRMNIDERREKGFFIRSSKKEADRFVALSPPTLDMLDRWIIEYRPKTDPKAVWTGEYGRLKAAVIRTTIKETGNIAGIPQLHPHAMRHFCATRLLKSGVDLRKVQIHRGHISIGSTQRYTHLMSSEIQAEIYDLYSRVREPYFFESLEEIAI